MLPYLVKISPNIWQHKSGGLIIWKQPFNLAIFGIFATVMYLFALFHNVKISYRNIV